MSLQYAPPPSDMHLNALIALACTPITNGDPHAKRVRDDAWELLIPSVDPIIIDVIANRVYDSSRYDDMQQEVRTKVFRKLDTYKPNYVAPEYAFRVWLLEVTRNEIVTYLVRGARRHADPPNVLDELKRRLGVARPTVDDVIADEDAATAQRTACKAVVIVTAIMGGTATAPSEDDAALAERVRCAVDALTQTENGANKLHALRAKYRGEELWAIGRELKNDQSAKVTSEAKKGWANHASSLATSAKTFLRHRLEHEWAGTDDTAPTPTAKGKR